MAKDTAQQILAIAQAMVRQRGYSAFSYADISKQVGIRKASIHYHFPSKDELVRELVRRYRQEMAQQCELIAQSKTSFKAQLMQFVHLYQDSLQGQQICLCAMLSADRAVLPASVRSEVRLFFQETEAWLAALLQSGNEAGVWTTGLNAKGLIAMLQGAQLLASAEADSRAAFEQIVYPMLPGS